MAALTIPSCTIALTAVHMIIICGDRIRTNRNVDEKLIWICNLQPPT